MIAVNPEECISLVMDDLLKIRYTVIDDDYVNMLNGRPRDLEGGKRSFSMETKILESETPKEITEVGECVERILINTAVELKNWSKWTSVPKILKRSFAEFLVAAKGASQVVTEAKERPMLATLGVLTPVCKGVDTLLMSMEKEQEGEIKGFVEDCGLSKEQEVERIMSFLGE